MSNPEITHLMAMRPIEFIGRNFRGRHRRLKAGNIWLAEMEVEREIWDVLDTMPEGAMFKIVLWMTDGTEQPAPQTAQLASQDDAFAFGVKQEPAEPLPLPEPEPPKKGPWGDFWRELYAHKFPNNAPLIHHLKVSGKGDTVKIALRARLNVTSLTDCSPDHLGAWLTQKIRQGADLRGAKEIADQVLEKLGGVEYKWGKKEKEDAA